jgi:hypothetical protein
MSGSDHGFNYGGKCQISWNHKIVIYKKTKKKQTKKSENTPLIWPSKIDITYVHVFPISGPGEKLIDVDCLLENKQMYSKNSTNISSVLFCSGISTLYEGSPSNIS